MIEEKLSITEIQSGIILYAEEPLILLSVFTTWSLSETCHKVFPNVCKRWGCSKIILESRHKLISFPVVMELSSNWSIHIGIRADIELVIAHKSMYKCFPCQTWKFF